MKKGLFLGLALVFVLAGCSGSDQNNNSNADVLAPEEAKTKAKDFISENLMGDSQQEAQVGEVTEENGLYKFEVKVQGRSIDSYMTKDGKKFFPQAMDTENPQQQTPSQGTSTPPQQQMSPEKRAKAVVPQMEQLLNQQGDKISEEERQNIKQKMDELKQLNKQDSPDSEELKSKIEELQKASQPLIQKMMEAQQSGQQGGQGTVQPAPQGGGQN